MTRLRNYSGEFGKSFLKIAWRDDRLVESLNSGEKKVLRETEAVLHYFAPQVESWMKLNAPWTDITGNARNGLAARAYSDFGEKGIILYHQVPYGIWLEVRFDGGYAIINPALEEWGPRVMSGLDRMLERL